MILFGILIALFGVHGIPVDNGVEGEPEIECGATSIIVQANTRTPFQGHVYVKSLYDQPNCRNDETGRQVAGIELPFDTCNVARTRSLNPKGIYVSTTIVISFHPQFVTKVDRAYRIQCFYMEADKTVSSQVAVSDLTTSFQSVVIPMPICKYEILSGGPTGEPVEYASIGQQVYHKWTCDTETIDTFCAVVHSCDRLEIIDTDGCALDKYILNNLEYPGDLNAGQEAHVYKYADRPQLFYQCQITISVKEPHAECPRPTCKEPNGYGAKKTTHTDTGNKKDSSSSSEDSSSEEKETRNSTYAPSPTLVPNRATRSSLSGESVESVSVPLRLLRRKRQAWEEGNVVDVRTEITAFDMLEPNPTEHYEKLQGRVTLLDPPNPSFCVSPASLAGLLLVSFLLSSLLLASLLLLMRCSSRQRQIFA